MSKSVTQWLADVVKHYGSLDKFTDARTVRIMRQFAFDTIAEHNQILDSISTDPENEGRKYYFDTFAEDIAAAKDQLEKLDMWLGDRGLTP
ncbi:hypothetical protein Cp1R7AA1_007 [Mesorhizobium phage Cp1R7A-A1]|nr:hypothetical protein Cp1R7AA1_007 [Mesorhizobium phage Cp1R7A-A1]